MVKSYLAKEPEGALLTTSLPIDRWEIVQVGDDDNEEMIGMIILLKQEAKKIKASEGQWIINVEDIVANYV